MEQLPSEQAVRKPDAAALAHDADEIVLRIKDRKFKGASWSIQGPQSESIRDFVPKDSARTARIAHHRNAITAVGRRGGPQQ